MHVPDWETAGERLYRSEDKGRLRNDAIIQNLWRVFSPEKGSRAFPAL